MFKMFNFFRKNHKAINKNKNTIKVNKSDVRNLLTFHEPDASDMYGDYYNIGGRTIYATSGLKTSELVKECDNAARHSLNGSVALAELQKEAIEKHIKYFLSNV